MCHSNLDTAGIEEITLEVDDDADTSTTEQENAHYKRTSFARATRQKQRRKEKVDFHHNSTLRKSENVWVSMDSGKQSTARERLIFFFDFAFSGSKHNSFTEFISLFSLMVPFPMLWTGVRKTMDGILVTTCILAWLARMGTVY